MRIYATTVLIAVSGFCYAQQQAANVVGQDLLAPPKLTPPSPNAAAFEKYGNIPVSAYTGVPSISIPLYQIRYRDVSLPVSLSYHASGIRVGEEASRVGLGWVLNCGGVVSRNVVGMDDFADEPAGFLAGTSGVPEFPMGPNFSPKQAVQGSPMTGFLNRITAQTTLYDLSPWVWSVDHPYDFQPDVFNYNFNNHSGRFLLRRDRTPIIAKKENIKIEIVGQLATAIKITDDQGFIYYFAAVETVVDNGSTGGAQKSSWYLTELISPQGVHVTFTYAALGQQMVGSLGSFYEMSSDLQLGCNEVSLCKPQPPVRNPIGKRIYSNLYLQKVEWDGGKLTFNVDTRRDVEGDVRVTSMQMFDSKTSSEPYEEVIFDQGYFQSDAIGFPFEYSVTDVDAPERAKLRLRLNSITRRTLPPNPNNQDEVHKFYYYESIKLPPKNSFARDHWGYYNGKHGNTSLIPSFSSIPGASNWVERMGIMGSERDPSEAHMSAFSLASVVYPTQGRTMFYYSANDFGVQGSSGGPQGGVPEAYKTTTSFLYDASVGHKGQVTSLEFDLTDQYQTLDHHTLPVELRAAFRTSGLCKNVTGVPNVYFEIYAENASSPLMRVTLGSNQCPTKDDLECLYCDKGAYSQMDVFKISKMITLPSGHYTWKAWMGSNESQIVDISTQATWWVDPIKRPAEQIDNTDRRYRLAGGLRIARIEDYDPETNQLLNVRKYDYHRQEDSNNDGIMEVYSYGRRMVAPNYSAYDLNHQSSGDDYCAQCIYLVRSSDSNIPLANASGTSIGYDRVKETFGEQGEFGYNIYEYENKEDSIVQYYGILTGEAITLRPPVVAGSSNPFNGMLKSQATYTSTNTLVRKIENCNVLLGPSETYWGMEIRRISGSMRFGTTADMFMAISYRAIESAFPYVSETKETIYNTIGTSGVKTTTKFSYENSTHLQVTMKQTSKSDGKLLTTVYKYPLDFPSAQRNSVVNMMIDNFQHAIPLETSIVEEVPDHPSAAKLLHRSVTKFGIFNGTKTLPSQVYAFESPGVFHPSTVHSYNPASDVDAVDTFTKIYDLDYDANNNVSRIQKDSDTPVSFIWGYGGEHVIAEATNATNQQVYFTSFEEDGTTFADPSGINAAHTGTLVRAASGFSFPATFTPGANMRMSYWYWSNNKWNFSGEIPYQASFTTSGTAIDDVRAYPIGSQMTSYTFHKVYGLTSISKPNGLVMYYNYDNRGRLRSVVDHLGKVLETYSYTFKR